MSYDPNYDPNVSLDDLYEKKSYDEWMKDFEQLQEAAKKFDAEQRMQKLKPLNSNKTPPKKKRKKGGVKWKKKK
jgi:hypothetical protein